MIGWWGRGTQTWARSRWALPGLGEPRATIVSRVLRQLHTLIWWVRKGHLGVPWVDPFPGSSDPTWTSLRAPLIRWCSVSSVMPDSVTPWTAARQAPLSMGVSRQECWSGLLCPPPGALLTQGWNPHLP